MTLKLNTVIVSTRPRRIGPSLGRWFNDVANEQGSFESRLVDLAEFDLPVYDEAHHPRMQKYEKEHTRAWSRSVADADAFVFVLPEYNFFPPPSFTNAIDYVYTEWNYKPCGFLSYGGISGGLRSAQIAKQLVTGVKMMPMVEGVSVQMAWKLLDEGQQFTPSDQHDSSARAMLEEMARWARALEALRTGDDT